MDVAATENFRKNLAVAIEARGIKKSHLATEAKTGRSYLDSLLKGEQEPGLAVADRLARAAGFPLIALLDAPENFADSVLTAVSN
jgi:transcriptional regulator with XRE-family HTH domain